LASRSFTASQRTELAHDPRSSLQSEPPKIFTHGKIGQPGKVGTLRFPTTKCGSHPECAEPFWQDGEKTEISIPAQASRAVGSSRYPIADCPVSISDLLPGTAWRRRIPDVDLIAFNAGNDGDVSASATRRHRHGPRDGLGRRAPSEEGLCQRTPRAAYAAFREAQL
jgi:hypothetical protein